MKKIIMISVVTVVIYSRLCAAEHKNVAISIDPVTFIELMLWGWGNDVEIMNIWLSMDLSWETEKQKEMGLGIFLRGDRVAATGKYRIFSNKERQSGFFWGFYGLAEWRRMYWSYDDDAVLEINWRYTVVGNDDYSNDNVYHSIGVTGGLDVGFRYRKGALGVTPYLGLGIPLFYCFGNLPQKDDYLDFYLMNMIFRSVNFGLKLDFFQ